jgi:hypothetical protein
VLLIVVTQQDAINKNKEKYAILLTARASVTCLMLLLEQWKCHVSLSVVFI